MPIVERKRPRRYLPLAGVALALIGLALPSAPVDASTIAAESPRTIWTSFYDGPANDYDAASSLIASPDGRMVFVGGGSDARPSDGLDFTTVAYRARTGARSWVAWYDGPSSDDKVESIAVSPDGERVFVTGWSTEEDVIFGIYDYATVAYDATTGEELWVALYDGPGEKNDQPLWVGVSPDGSRVYVTGSSWATEDNPVAATIAYDAESGAELWAALYDGPGRDRSDAAFSGAVSPDGSRVYVSGESHGGSTYEDFATIAYDASTGAELWVARHEGARYDSPRDMAMSVDGARLYVTGTTNSGGAQNYFTVAYDAATGGFLWADGYDGPAEGDGADIATAVAIDPGGERVYVTGGSPGVVYNDYATVGYDASTGAELWVARYEGPSTEDGAESVAVSPDGARVYVTGGSRDQDGIYYDYATVAYRATTGESIWVARLATPGSDNAYEVVVAPSGRAVYVTGRADYQVGDADFATVAYRS
jgi:WD40 repeat protein